MCRALLYLGQSLGSRHLLYGPDNALVKQSYHPRMMAGLLNLGGFGLAAWHKQFHQSAKPFVYKTQELSVYDQNLRSFSNNFVVNCMLGHVRGVAYTADHIVMRENAHPFYYQNTDVAFAHNGTLARLNTLKPELFRQIKPQFSQQITGTTDSEWMYALFLSQLNDPANTTMTDAIEAVQKTLAILARLRKKCGVAINSPINLFISNGQYILATRFVFDYGIFQHSKDISHNRYHSLWYTVGHEYVDQKGQYCMRCGDKTTSMIIASEPLTLDTTTWIPVPEYSLIAAQYRGKQLTVRSVDIDI